MNEGGPRPEGGPNWSIDRTGVRGGVLAEKLVGQGPLFRP